MSTVECNKNLSSKSLLTKVRAFNHKIEKIAQEKNIVYIDLNKDGLSNDIEGLLPQHTYYGIHLSGADYNTIYNIIKDHIYQ